MYARSVLPTETGFLVRDLIFVAFDKGASLPLGQRDSQLRKLASKVICFRDVVLRGLVVAEGGLSTDLLRGVQALGAA